MCAVRSCLVEFRTWLTMHTQLGASRLQGFEVWLVSSLNLQVTGFALPHQELLTPSGKTKSQNKIVINDSCILYVSLLSRISLDSTVSKLRHLVTEVSLRRLLHWRSSSQIGKDVIILISWAEIDSLGRLHPICLSKSQYWSLRGYDASRLQAPRL
jgi:hypothetical protein